VGVSTELMQENQIQALLKAELAECEITVSSEGSHCDVTVVGDVFKGLRPLKRQQLVYAVLAESIASGEIHAVNMKLYDCEQWAQRS
jgi:acid stress-induced BolA-like protein IbaG/YrbA